MSICYVSNPWGCYFPSQRCLWVPWGVRRAEHRPTSWEVHSWLVVTHTCTHTHTHTHSHTHTQLDNFTGRISLKPQWLVVTHTHTHQLDNFTGRISLKPKMCGADPSHPWSRTSVVEPCSSLLQLTQQEGEAKVAYENSAFGLGCSLESLVGGGWEKYHRGIKI